MTDVSNRPATGIPADDPARTLAVASADAPGTRHLAIAGGTYTILLGGDQTAGRYCLIEMRVPPGGGPPPHRHDFEEMFTVLDGEIEVSFRGEAARAGAGSTVNIPANAPHSFKNVADAPARLLCMCSPAGQEEFFLAVGDLVATSTTPGPKLTPEEQGERVKKVIALAPSFRSEILLP